MDKILVSICSITYNHASYIRQCLDGFLMQKCDFDYEVLIHDDASSDSTVEIIKEYQELYPNIIKPIFQVENQYSQGVRNIQSRYNFSRAKGKYIAMCEGDDYWTDPLKLQKQVAALTKNTNASLCCHAWKVVDEKGNIISNYEPNGFVKPTLSQKSFSLKEFIEMWITKTLTVMFRKDLLNVEEIWKYDKPVDKHLYYSLLKVGSGVFINEIMGAYRIHSGGVVSVINSQKKNEIIGKIAKDIYENNANEPYARKMYLRFLQKKIKQNILIYGYLNSFSKNSSLFKEINRIAKNLPEYRHILIPYLPRYIITICKRAKKLR